MRRIFTEFVLFLLFGMNLYGATRPQTTVIYVNGIWSSESRVQEAKNILKGEFEKYVSNLPGVADSVKFDYVYNRSQGFQDLLESFGQLSDGYAKYLAESPNTLENIEDDAKAAVVVTIDAYSEALGRHLQDWLSSFGIAPTRPKTQAELDLESLIDKIVMELRVGNKVVLIGHSQGNLFINAAYDHLLQWQGRYLDGTGIQLPDTSKLVAIGVSTPADHVADETEIADRKGKQRYTTGCTDFIWDIPHSLPYNTVGITNVGLLDYEMCGEYLLVKKLGDLKDKLAKLLLIDK